MNAAGIPLLFAASLAGCSPDAATDGAPIVTLYYAPEQSLQTIVDACNARAAGRYRIRHRVLPRSADEQRIQMVRRLAAQDPDMDVLGLDVTWTPEFASAGWIREWTGDQRVEVERGALLGPLRSARHDGKLYAAPKNTNVQLLWYRTDLVSRPPRTWDDLIRAAQRLKREGRPYRVITMGAEYEGLVVLYNTVATSAGGRLLDDDGNRAIVDAGAVRALAILQRFATAGITSPSFTNALEDDARLEFQAGGGAFQLNWPYVYAAMVQDAPALAESVGWARYPAVDAAMPSRVTIGGYNLAVSAYSRHPAESFDAALCLRSAEHQRYSAIHGGVPPTIERLYQDPGIATAYPMKDVILAELRDAALRPRTPAYQNVSTVVAELLSPPSAIDPQRTASQLRGAVQAALESRGVLP